MAKVGRPTDYTPELGEKICLAISTSEMGLHRLKKLHPDWFPDVSTIFYWIAKHEEFSKQYTRAKEIQAELIFEKIIEISDDSSGDEMVTKEGAIENREFVNRSKLRVDSRKWQLSKLLPKKYGEKQTIEHEGEIKTPIQPPTIVFEISKEIADKATAKLNAKP